MALNLKGKTLFITGASRGIGKAIGLRAARDGANVVIAAKTAEPHPKLPGTIYTAKEEIEAAGGKALACIVDIRVRGADPGGREAGGRDVRRHRHPREQRERHQPHRDGRHADEALRPDARGQHARHVRCARRRASRTSRRPTNPHILNISPPLNMEARWFAPHVAYTMAKFGMSMCVLGMAEELKRRRSRSTRSGRGR